MAWFSSRVRLRAGYVVRWRAVGVTGVPIGYQKPIVRLDADYVRRVT